MDKYLLVYSPPSTFSSSVSVTDLRIVDSGVLALTGGCGRYADVIHPSSTGMATLPFYCTVQIKGVKQLRFFPLQPASCTSALHPCLGLGRLETFMAPYLLAVMACCWLARDGLGRFPLLLKPRVYYGELSPAGLEISRYIGATWRISG